MKLVSVEDFRDLYLKIVQRGITFIFSKLSVNEKKRTRSAFNSVSIDASNYWVIPLVRMRWNEKITGNPQIGYEEFISKEFFAGYKTLKLLSIGSGVCSHELKLAELNPDWEITCIDISDKLLALAEATARNKALKNIGFLAADIYSHTFPENYYDVVLFHSSLHHFKNIADFIPKRIKTIMKPGGKLILHEFVGAKRLQYSGEQIKAINACIGLIDIKYRGIYKTRLIKKHYFGSGILRMILADPSECVDSESIIPVVHNEFKIIFEKPLGGNLLMSALKDIAHHFVELDTEKEETLHKLFDFEDKYLESNASDLIFGIYKKTIN